MGVRRFLAGALLLAALALGAPAAALADASLTPSGALIYTWHGDPARGCARVGVCGIEGSLIVRPQDFAFLAQASKLSGFIDFGDVSATVRVRRTEAGSSGDCVDTRVWPNAGDGSLLIRWQRNGAAALTLPRVDGPSSGHCAGPLSGELPTRVVGRRLPGHSVRFAFPDTISFAAGPYSGTLVSTLGLAPDTSGDSSSGSSSGPTWTSSGTVFDERVALTYRIALAPGTLRATLSGERDPLCITADSCSTSGALALSFGAHQATVTVIADRYVHHRVGRRATLADFRARRLPLNNPYSIPGDSFSSSETLRRAGGVTCTDDAPGASASVWLGSPFLPPSFAIGPNGPFLTHQSRTIPVLITLDDPSSALRTNCAGPDGIDVFGGHGVLGRGVVDFGRLLAPRFSVRLIPAARFSALGYDGATTGALTVTMSLIKVRAGTLKESA